MKHGSAISISLILLLNPLLVSNIRAAEWQELFIHDSFHLHLASSELDYLGPYELGPYGAHNLFDHDSSTCWAEGVPGNGIGESLYIGFEENLETIFVVNGFPKTMDLFYENNRVKDIRISIFVGINKPGNVTEIFVLYDAMEFDQDTIIQLEDTMVPQAIAFPFSWEELIQFKESSLQMFVEDHTEELDDRGIEEDELYVDYVMLWEILDIYEGSKYEDTCISDIWFLYP